MIPVSLIIKGLYSYQEEQKIVFDRLIEGQLFGIFGSVGSGKSSILEAISFALYGETERLNQRDNRNYNMMNLKSDELLIDFEFKNYDDENYRFMVRGKRNGKDFNKVNTFDRTAYKYVNNEWEPLEYTSAEPVLGLSYENFRRTIIIPQGKFQEFLQLGDKARTDMLKEIFNLNKYEFFYQTTNLERQNNEALQNLDGQLLHFEMVSQELISKKEQEVEELYKALSKQKALLQEKDVLFQAQQNLKKLVDDQESFQSELNKLLASENQIKALDKKVQEYEYCILNFKDKLNRKSEIEQKLRNSNESLLSMNQSFDSYCKQLDELNAEFIEAQTEFLRLDEFKETVSDYKLILSLNQLKVDHDVIEKRISDGEAVVNNTTEGKQEAQKKLDELKQKGRVLKSELPDIRMLSNIREWFLKKEHIEDAIKLSKARIQQLNTSATEIVVSIKEQLKLDLLREIENGSYPDYHIAQVLNLRKESQVKQEQIQNQISHFHLQIKLGEFTGQLEKGEACMLCGSNHHPQILKVEDVQSHLLLAQKQMNEMKALDSFLEKTHQELSAFIYQEQSIRNQIQEVDLQLSKDTESLLAHNQEFHWDNFSPTEPEKVQAAFKVAEETQKELSTIEDNIQDYEKVVQKKLSDYERFASAVSELKLQLKGKEAESETLKRQIRKLSFSDHEHLSENEVIHTINQLTEKIQSVNQRFEHLSNQIKLLNDKKLIEAERISSMEQILIDNDNALQKLDEELNTYLVQSPFFDFEYIQSILRESFDVNTVKNQISDYNQQLYSLKQQLKQLKALLGEQSFDAVQFTELEGDLLQLRRYLEEVNTRFIHEEKALIDAKRDFERKIQLEKQCEKLQHRAANINTLKQLFKGSGFVSYISTVYLQNLCEVANMRFYKLTRQRLRLEVTDKNDFQVRDFLNNGKVRNVKTLSGGQTFQASLSLALALAESVQQQNKSKQNFFFLDEGFGSLDKESLQIAFETLKSLRKENRIVGIISHVEELQQEIDVFLSITNDPFTGSNITRNWE